MLGCGPLGGRLPLPPSCEPAFLQLDTACQVAPEESTLGASSAKVGGGKTEGDQALLFRDTSLLLQRWGLERLMVSDFYMVFGTSFQSKEGNETLQSLQTLNTMSWQ